MRLLHSRSGEIREFISDEDVPPYAILSHTWATEEVSFRDWQTSTPEIKARQGYLKIKQCCEQAAREELDWVWIDTCCIDKTSSAELSEAINSMFRWYQTSAICFVYLSDLTKSEEDDEWKESLRYSRWFTRGWTLQELIAPTKVDIFDKDWEKLGTKSELEDLISSITGIEKAFLDGNNLEKASVAKKMSWAAKRQTSRSEDIAYSLLGLFDVNLPLIYGEGKKAFQRLQIEIMRQYPDDHTLFAWGKLVGKSSLQVTEEEVVWGKKRLDWDNEAANRPLLGLLAKSPLNFESSGSLVPAFMASRYYKQTGEAIPIPLPFQRGIRISLPNFQFNSDVTGTSVYHWKSPRVTQIRHYEIMILLCGYANVDSPFSFVGVPLQCWGVSCWGRSPEIVSCGYVFSSQFDESTPPLYVEPQPPSLEGPQHGDFLFRRVSHAGVKLGWTVDWGDDSNLRGPFSYDRMIQVKRPEKGIRVSCEFEMERPRDDDLSVGFRIIFSRNEEDPDATGLGPISINFLPVVFSTTQTEWQLDGITWQNYGVPMDTVQSELPLVHLPATENDSEIWSLDDKRFPNIQIEIERMPLEEPGTFVDVVDLLMGSKTDRNNEDAKSKADNEDAKSKINSKTSGSTKSGLSGLVHTEPKKESKRFTRLFRRMGM